MVVWEKHTSRSGCKKHQSPEKVCPSAVACGKRSGWRGGKQVSSGTSQAAFSTMGSTCNFVQPRGGKLPVSPVDDQHSGQLHTTMFEYYSEDQNNLFLLVKWSLLPRR